MKRVERPMLAERIVQSWKWIKLYPRALCKVVCFAARVTGRGEERR